jgi:hypothetical protein
MNSPTPLFTTGTPSSEAKQGAALFLITGATGNTGDTTVRLLLQRGHRVRAFVHRSDARSESLAADGAEIVVGDLLNFPAVSAAMRGVTGAYFCYPIAPGLLDAIAIFAQAASEAGVKAVGQYVPDLRTPRGEQQRCTPALDWRTPAGPHRHADGPFAADVLRRMADLVLELPCRRGCSATSFRKWSPRANRWKGPSLRHRRHPGKSGTARPPDLPALRPGRDEPLRDRRCDLKDPWHPGAV